MRDYFKRQADLINPLINQHGFALFLSIFMILAFSVLGLTLINIIPGLDTDIWVKQLTSARSFYLAESARHYFLEYVVSHDTDFTDDAIPNNTITKQLGTGTFSITYSNKAVKTTDMTFSGNITNPNITMSIAQSFDGWTNVPQAFKHALFLDDPGREFEFGFSGGPHITGDVYSSGSIYCMSKGGSWINGNVFASKGFDIQTSGTYKEFQILGDVYLRDGAVFSVDHGLTPPSGTIPCTCPGPAPCNVSKPANITGNLYCGDEHWPMDPGLSTWPTLDPTYYDQEIAIAQTIGGGDCNYSGYLNGENRYCNGSLWAGGNIYGGTSANPACPVSIVITGNFGLPATIGNYMTLIGGRFLSAGVLNIGNGTIIYSFGTAEDWFEGIHNNGSFIAPSKNVHAATAYGPTYNGILYILSEDQPPFQNIGNITMKNPTHTFMSFDLTYDETSIPLAVKGLYNIRYTPWREE